MGVSLRSVFIATYPFEVNVADLQKLLADKKIENAVKDAIHYQEYVRKIRTPFETEQVERQIRHTKDEIDELVFDLYSLSARDKATVVAEVKSVTE